MSTIYLTKTVIILPGLNEIQLFYFIPMTNVFKVSSENIVKLALVESLLYLGIGIGR